MLRFYLSLWRDAFCAPTALDRFSVRVGILGIHAVVILAVRGLYLIAARM